MNTFYQLNTIFISMIIEAIPFVLLGVFISGFIHMFVTEPMVARIMPKNRVLAILIACVLGAMFPACDCGIVPIVRRLVRKGVPLHAGIAFMLTGPVINPIVLFATFIAFGNNWSMVFLRAGLSIVVAIAASLIISFMFKDSQLRSEFETSVADPHQHPDQHHQHEKQHKHSTGQEHEHDTQSLTLGTKIMGTLTHAIDEFFSVGKFLLLGAFVAASMQTFLKTQTLINIGQTDLTASLVMMALAFILSLCSEADAFIASSFRSTFSVGSLTAFMVFGPMIDIKNTLMLLGSFKTKFVVILTLIVTFLVLIGSLLI